MRNVSSTAVILMFVLSAAKAQAQQSYKWMIGVNGGAMIYQGDLTPSPFGSYRTASLTLGLSAARILNSYFAVRGSLSVGNLRGDDASYSAPAWRKARNFSFSTPVSELSAQLVWNPFGNNSNELGLRVTPYLFGGAGLSVLHINRDYSRMDTNVFSYSSKQQTGLRIDIAVVPPRSILVLPVGVGLSFYLAPRWSINAETSFRYSFTDYLDGFSYSANSNQKDFYHTHTIGLVYRLGGSSAGDKLGCPKF